MCIIISRPQGVTLDKELYERCAGEHEDGAGVAFINPDTNLLEVHKGFFKFKKFWEFIQPLDKVEMLIHFRNASYGTPINAEMCHPFEVDTEGVYMTERNGKEVPRFQFAIAHNGRLDWTVHKQQSDTSSFINDCLAVHLRHYPWFLHQGYGLEILKRTIGTWNKMVVFELDVKENKYYVHIANESAGEKDLGCWFSNTSYKAPVKNTWVGGYGSDRAYGTSEYDGVCTSADISDLKDAMANAKMNEHFIKPDQNGWRWSMQEDMWINIKTLDRADYLDSRPQRPVYMDKKPQKTSPVWHGGYDPSKPSPKKPEQLALPASVVVPRDKEAGVEVVNPEGEVVQFPVNKKPRDRKMEIKGDGSVDIHHYEKWQQTILRKMANLYCTDDRSGYSKTKASSNQMIQLLREDVKTYKMPAATVYEIDLWIITQSKQGRDVVKIICDQVEADQKVEAQEAAEGVTADLGTVV
jgi:hypothetical protein